MLSSAKEMQDLYFHRENYMEFKLQTLKAVYRKQHALLVWILQWRVNIYIRRFIGEFIDELYV